MSSQKTHTYDVDDCEDYDYNEQYDEYDDFSINHNVKSKNNKKESKTTIYSNKHIRNYTKRYSK
jgi:hypothetical protein